MLAKTKAHSEFLIRETRIIWGEIVRKIPVIMTGSSRHGTFEEPFACALGRKAAERAYLPQQGRDVRRIAQSLRQRWSGKLFSQFH